MKFEDITFRDEANTCISLVHVENRLATKLFEAITKFDAEEIFYIQFIILFMRVQKGGYRHS